jgi:hypothetical protein
VEGHSESKPHGTSGLRIVNYDTARGWHLAPEPVEKHVVLVLTSANSNWIYESEENLKDTEIPLKTKGDKGSPPATMKEIYLGCVYYVLCSTHAEFS